MRAIDRLGATIAIWLGFTISLAVFVTARDSPMPVISEPAMILGILMVAVAATISTRAVWQSLSRQESEQAKTKRAEHHRIKRLVDELDDAAVHDLEVLLMARDEYVTRDEPSMRERHRLPDEYELRAGRSTRQG